jgi:hypothetical protein
MRRLLAQVLSALTTTVRRQNLFERRLVLPVAILAAVSCFVGCQNEQQADQELELWPGFRSRSFWQQKFLVACRGETLHDFCHKKSWPPGGRGSPHVFFKDPSLRWDDRG